MLFIDEVNLIEERRDERRQVVCLFSSSTSVEIAFANCLANHKVRSCNVRSHAAHVRVQ